MQSMNSANSTIFPGLNEDFNIPFEVLTVFLHLSTSIIWLPSELFSTSLLSSVQCKFLDFVLIL